ERYTQDVRVLRNVMQQRSASQLDIIRVRTEEEDSFTVEIHIQALSLRGGVKRRRSREASSHHRDCFELTLSQ
ncbi:MAG TPA: hypothetical protein VFQ23_21345, partial [Anaerolineales bacterium]|nr:hypothetical protein [Anaerolineales bacterium]